MLNNDIFHANPKYPLILSIMPYKLLKSKPPEKYQYPMAPPPKSVGTPAITAPAPPIIMSVFMSTFGMYYAIFSIPGKYMT